MNKKITTVIVTFNSLRNNWIYKCLDALMESNYKTEIIIIDNNSTDDTCNIIKEKYPEVILIENKENKGFGQANNQGFEYGLKNGSDYFFLLNQDAYVETTTIKSLVEQSLKNHEYGILSPIHFNYNGGELEHYFSVFMSTAKTPFFFAEHILKKPREIYDTKFVNAAAWLIPRQTVLDIGGFDTMFFQYGEDDNYCQRVLYHGYKIGVVTGCFIYHDSYIRVQPNDYLESAKYLEDIEKTIKTNYGNINVDINDYYRNEIKSVYYKMLINALTFKFKSLPNFMREMKIIKKSFTEIHRSREINKGKGCHYLNL
ncbi:glycosyltransferase family 2 protein [Chryseobacterium sp. MP_3.2]|uniref:glycosyltransferase family 2 protein n=1 Tax=Chryseobacterium sp. MP_3.2 TaxID=3071712 RepID=UPI002E044940|nr:GT2 family glycosyltransferase [Chryseobacterium sp. MP_3.2]